MAESAPPRPRRGPAPIASFDHDNSDESSPESKAAKRLPEIRELLAEEPRGSIASAVETSALDASDLGRPRSVSAAGLPAPRIDISRASSSSQQDSRDSSPELALCGAAPAALGFREDGALDLRSSTEELAFLEPEPEPPPPPPPPARRHSRKDSQSSEAALLAVSGRTSRLSSVGSACSAQSQVSRVSRLSVVSGVSGISRSPSPHNMLLETSFCGPRPIETEPDVETQLLALTEPSVVLAPTVDARDLRSVCTEVTVEQHSTPRIPPTIAPVTSAVPVLPVPAQPASSKFAASRPATSRPATHLQQVVEPVVQLDEEKKQKETKNRARVEERRSRPRLRREPSEPEVYKSANRTKNVVRIRLKPSEEYDDDEPEQEPAPVVKLPEPEARKPVTLELRTNSPRRSPSPGPVTSRKSSFCSLFKSRETIASPETPLRRKRSLTEGRARSRSRDSRERSHTPTTSARLRGSVLALFRGPSRRSSTAAAQPPASTTPRSVSPRPPDDRVPSLKYYEDSRDGIIHIPLKTPPDDGPQRPASAPHARSSSSTAPLSRPTQRTVLPDGSIIIPLHSPTEKVAPSSPVFVSLPQSKEEVASSPPKKEQEIDPAPPTPIQVIHSPPKGVPCTSPGSQRQSSVTSPTSVEMSSPPATSATMVTPATETPATDTPALDSHRSRRERIVFTTHVGSTEQVFSTQFSITKTPSVTSEISGAFTLPESEEVREPPPLRDTRIGSTPSPPGTLTRPASRSVAGTPMPGTPMLGTPAADAASSESENSSDAGAARVGSDAEQRGLVVQESFEELPYVPTTLPQERPLALPMVPVRERGGVRVAAVRRPRGSLPSVPAPRAPLAAPAPVTPPAVEKIHIRLPRRPRTASATSERRRTESISGVGAGLGAAGPAGAGAAAAAEGAASARRADWVSFSEAGGERRRTPRTIQTLPARTYVPPEDCRCSCHHHQHQHSVDSSSGSSPECAAAASEACTGGGAQRGGDLPSDAPTNAERLH